MPVQTAPIMPYRAIRISADTNPSAYCAVGGAKCCADLCNIDEKPSELKTHIEYLCVTNRSKIGASEYMEGKRYGRKNTHPIITAELSVQK